MWDIIEEVLAASLFFNIGGACSSLCLWLAEKGSTGVAVLVGIAAAIAFIRAGWLLVVCLKRQIQKCKTERKK